MDVSQQLELIFNFLFVPFLLKEKEPKVQGLPEVPFRTKPPAFLHQRPGLRLVSLSLIPYVSETSQGSYLLHKAC